MSTQPVRIAVIMAGGAGERFWPLSRQRRPKQLLRLTRPDLTLLEESVERVAGMIPRERVFVATARPLVGPIREARTGVPDENVLGEPCKRNTAGCLAWSAAQALARFGEQPVTMAVLTADHAIENSGRFAAAVDAACTAAERHEALVTIGVTPTRPETGYGYIEVAEDAAPYPHAAGSPPVFPVARFREKPDRIAAEAFIASGRFFWNSGMFFWTLAAFMRELEQAAPVHAGAVTAMAGALRRGDEAEADRLFGTLPDISIDFALMEKAGRVLMVQAEFAWDDVGALDALDRGLARDADGNVTLGDPVLIETRDSIVYNEPGTEQIAVATVGVTGLAVIVTRDGVLVIPKNRVQDVKLVVNELKKRGASQL